MDPKEVEPDRVTSGKAKSPGRVAWGKKLATLAKAHKKEKAEVAAHDRVAPHMHLPAWLALGSLVIGLTALYYQRRASLGAPSCPVERPQQPETPEPRPKNKSKIIAME